jgi:hypothetical protein
LKLNCNTSTCSCGETELSLDDLSAFVAVSGDTFSVGVVLGDTFWMGVVSGVVSVDFVTSFGDSFSDFC